MRILIAQQGEHTTAAAAAELMIKGVQQIKTEKTGDICLCGKWLIRRLGTIYLFSPGQRGI